MPSSSFFDKPPTSDKTLGRVSKWFAPSDQFRNGYFQHIVWLGVNGYAIINHFKPKQILLLDPWPSYRRKSWKRRSGASQKRLQALVEWLRTMHSRDYALDGVLISHQHFDHVADIPAIFEMLVLPRNRKVKVANLDGFKVTMKSDPIPIADLPCVYADRTSLKEIKTSNEARSLSMPTEEIKWLDGEHLDYEHAQSSRPAGTRLAPITLGGFRVTPYVWDHMNLCQSSYNFFGMAGNRQRQTAFLVQHTASADAKKTFLIGSAGEMSPRFTHGVIDQDQKIETDTLVTSITLPTTTETYAQQKAMVSYQHRNILVNDYIVASHWENFVFGPTKSFKDLKKKYCRVTDYKNQLALVNPGDAKKVGALKRLGFSREVPRIPNATDMTWS